MLIKRSKLYQIQLNQKDDEPKTKASYLLRTKNCSQFFNVLANIILLASSRTTFREKYSKGLECILTWPTWKQDTVVRGMEDDEITCFLALDHIVHIGTAVTVWLSNCQWAGRLRDKCGPRKALICPPTNVQSVK